ncbi:MAG: AAA family ATPase [Chitinophagales bacterium]
MAKYIISDIFKTIGTPRVTYVKRNEGEFEFELTNGLSIPGTLCLLTGPSKTGKTTLYKKVISELKKIPLTIRCNDEMTIEDVWRNALEEVNFDRITKQAESGQIELSSQVKTGMSAGWEWLGKIIGEISLGIKGTYSSETVREKILSTPSPKHLIPILKELPYVLVVEDFHYLNDTTKKSVFQQWKDFTDSEVATIIVGTAHHAVDLALSNKDLVGRISHTEVGTWEVNDLKKIVKQGLDELKVNISEPQCQYIASESVGLPLITQGICARLFLDKKITTYDTKDKMTFVKSDIETAMTNVANQNFNVFKDIYQILITGFRKGARKYNTYELLLLIFTLDPVSFKLVRSEIDSRLDKLDSKFEKPPFASVNSTLGSIGKLQKKNGIELLEWSNKQGCLYILEPSFLFYLRWKDINVGITEKADLLAKIYEIISSDISIKIKE